MWMGSGFIRACSTTLLGFITHGFPALLLLLLAFYLLLCYNVRIMKLIEDDGQHMQIKIYLD